MYTHLFVPHKISWKDTLETSNKGLTPGRGTGWLGKGIGDRLLYLF